MNKEDKMSRVGNAIIKTPAGTSVSVNGDRVDVKGPKGELSQALVSMTSVEVSEGLVRVVRSSESKTARANHGLMRALLNNMVTGVTAGFSKQLEVNGIGYRADVKGNVLVMQLGYSHPIEYPVPAGISITADKNNLVTVTGIDKQLVCQVAANIRGYRSPDSYKGKGVRYVGEHVRLKAGKSA
jgi:large subunit ribosomal protein L6